MNRKKELRKLSKNQLIDRIDFLESKLDQVEHLLKLFDNPNTPSSKVRSKKNTERDDSQPRFPGKPPGSNGGGVKLPPPDKEETVEKEHCNCGAKLGKPCDSYSFRQMDIPTPEFVTTKYNVCLYKCSCCGELVDAGIDMQKGFIGPNATAFFGCLKEEGLSHEAVARLIGDTYKLPISNVGVFNKITQMSMMMRPEREVIRQAIIDAKWAGMDETGFREDGLNGQVWGLTTNTHCLFEYNRSRGAFVAQNILEGFTGALTTDDYKSYAWYKHRQLCWAHLIRHSKDAAEKYNGAQAQYQRIKTLYDKAKRTQKEEDHGMYEKLVWEMEDIATCYRAIRGCKNMYSMLHNRADLWLLGVKLNYVPLTNNITERRLRKVVLHRNRIGCIRTEAGKEFISSFLTCTSTWRIQGKSTYDELLKYAQLT